jgi:NADH dehydrogenase
VRSVADALIGAYGVVNAVSLYAEHGRETFHSVHVESAQRVATQAYRARVKHVAHVSGIGADAASQSLYIRKRGEGELAVRAAFADSLLIRPAVMFGPDDAFLTTILKLLRGLPFYPMFGRGLMRLQPAYVEDVAEAIARALQGEEAHPITYEFCGPHVYSYEEFLRAVAHEADLKPILIPVPFAAWHVLAWMSEMLPSTPVTRNQVELMQIDNVCTAEMPGFGQLGISPHSFEEILQQMLRSR